MSLVAAIRTMLGKGWSIDQALEAAEAIEASAAPQRTARQERNRRYYEAHKTSSEKRLNASETVLNSLNASDSDVTPSPLPAPSPDKEIPPTPSKENNLFPDPAPQPRLSRAREAIAFEERFWPAYPHKVGKRDAQKAMDGALKRADIETIMAGLASYAAKTDDRPWCNPATWLNQDRWTDQPAQVARGSPRKPLTGLAAITESFKQELAENGYSDESEEGGSARNDERLPLLAIPDHRGHR